MLSRNQIKLLASSFLSVAIAATGGFLIGRDYPSHQGCLDLNPFTTGQAAAVPERQPQLAVPFVLPSDAELAAAMRQYLKEVENGDEGASAKSRD